MILQGTGVKFEFYTVELLFETNKKSELFFINDGRFYRINDLASHNDSLRFLNNYFRLERKKNKFIDYASWNYLIRKKIKIKKRNKQK